MPPPSFTRAYAAFLAAGLSSSRLHLNSLNSTLPFLLFSIQSAPFMLGISKEENGSSLTVPTFYSEVYMDTWVIPNGLKIPGNFVRPK